MRLSSIMATAAAAASKLLSVDYEIFGKVQGVYFRNHTVEKAKALGLVGWVMNNKSGTVIGQVQGKEDKIKIMKKWLKQTGSPKSKIDKAEFKNEKEITQLDYSSFVRK